MSLFFKVKTSSLSGCHDKGTQINVAETSEMVHHISRLKCHTMKESKEINLKISVCVNDFIFLTDQQ